jgi:excisionase family DNA binding protein
MPTTTSQLLTAKQCAARLGVSDKFVYRLFHAKKLRGLQVEGAVRIYLASLEEYIRAHSNAPPEPAPVVPASRPRRGGDDFLSYYSQVMNEIQARRRPAG